LDLHGYTNVDGIGIEAMTISKFVVICAVLALGSTGCSTVGELKAGNLRTSILCNDIGKLRSKSSEEPVTVQFQNSGNETLQLIWVDYDGEEVVKDTIPPRQKRGQNTFVSHPWILRNEAGDCTAAFISRTSELLEIY